MIVQTSTKGSRRSLRYRLNKAEWYVLKYCCTFPYVWKGRFDRPAPFRAAVESLLARKMVDHSHGTIFLTDLGRSVSQGRILDPSRETR